MRSRNRRRRRVPSLAVALITFKWLIIANYFAAAGQATQTEQFPPGDVVNHKARSGLQSLAALIVFSAATKIREHSTNDNAQFWQKRGRKKRFSTY